MEGVMPISIVMPCYNEAAIIEDVVRTYHDGIISKIDGSEFIIIDDCSTDGTSAILKKLEHDLSGVRVLTTGKNSGHGKTVRIGYEAAAKEWVFQIDSDIRFELADFWKIYSLRNEYDFILGFRQARSDSLIRRVLSAVIRMVNFIIFGVWIKDANCPLRLIKKDILGRLVGAIDKEALAPNIMISLLAKKQKVKMAEVPVVLRERRATPTLLMGWNLTKFSAKGFRQLISFRKGLYNKNGNRPV